MIHNIGDTPDVSLHETRGTPPRKVLHLICQAHLDPVWLWPIRDGAAEALTTIQSATDRAAEIPAFKFTRSSAAVYRWIKDADPCLYAKVGRLLMDDRWEAAGGWIEQPDCNLPTGESFIRQALYAKSFMCHEFGPKGDSTIGYVPDSFGHSAGLPQLLKATGFDAYVFMRPEPCENPEVPMLFWWQSVDGSRVLAQRIPGCYSQSYSSTVADVETAIRRAANDNFAPGFDHGVFWFGIGNHGGGPTREHLAKVLELQNDATLPELRFSTMKEYFQAVAGSRALDQIPIIEGDIGYPFRGCYSANGEVKLAHRRAEKALFRAESVSVLAGIAKPDRLKEAWWRLLFNQFHDVLAGTCISQVDSELKDQFGAVLTSARELALQGSLKLARSVDTRDEAGSVLFVMNPLPWPRTALIYLDTFVTPNGCAEITHLQSREGSQIPIQWLAADANFGPWGLKWGKMSAIVNLPPGGYEVYRVVTKPLEIDLSTSEEHDSTNPQFSAAPCEQRKISTSVERNSTALKVNDQAVLSGPITMMIIKDESGTWGHGVRQYNEVIGEAAFVGAEILESGPLITVVREKYTWDGSEIWMDIVRSSCFDGLELRFRINWQQRRQQLKLVVPTRLNDTAVFARMAGEVARRSCNGEEFPCQDWLLLEGTFGKGRASIGVINNGTYSYDCAGGVLRTILARSVPFAEHPPFNYKDDSNVHFLDQGWMERRFLIVNSPKTLSELERLAMEYQLPGDAIMDNGHPGSEPWTNSLFSVDPESLSVLAIKPAEDGNGTIVRVQQFADREVLARICLHGGTMELSVRPWEIVSVRFPSTGDGPIRQKFHHEPIS